jgi:hypothetical protein
MRAPGEESWKLLQVGTRGDVSLTDGVVEYAKTLLPGPAAVRQGHAAASSQVAGGRGLS